MLLELLELLLDVAVLVLVLVLVLLLLLVLVLLELLSRRALAVSIGMATIVPTISAAPNTAAVT
jgi:hypothetical protein